MTNRNLQLLVPKEPFGPDNHSLATVTQASPLRIKLDGESTALPFTPITLTYGLLVNDRVLVLLWGNPVPASRSRRVIVLGRAGGDVQPATPPAAVMNEQGSNGTTTATSFTDTLTTSPGAAVAFVAAPSGRAMVHNAARMVNSAANETYCGFHVRTGATPGSGTDVLVASDDRSLIHVGTSIERHGVAYLLSGLTAGNSYNVVQAFRVSAGTGTYAYRTLVVNPAT